MDFLQDLLVNPRGVNVVEVAGQLSSRGLEPVSHTPGGGGLVPITELPADGSGAFTVFDPDGNPVFFNTHPPELTEYAQWKAERPEPSMDVPVTLPLGQLVVCFDVKDLAASTRFYRDLGFELAAETEDSATFTALPPHTTTALAPSAYPVLLRRAETAKAHLAFRCEDPKAVAASIRALGIDVEETPHGPAFLDPDGRRVALL